MPSAVYTYNIHARRLRAMLHKVEREELLLGTMCPAATNFENFENRWANWPCIICQTFVGLAFKRIGLKCPCSRLEKEAEARSWEAIDTYLSSGQLWKPPAKAVERELITITRHIIVPAPATGIGWYAVKEWYPSGYSQVSLHRSEEEAEEAIATYEGRR